MTTGRTPGRSKAKWEKRRTAELLKLDPLVPGPLGGGRLLESAGQRELPSCAAMEEWLRKHGVEASEWKHCKGGKESKDLWKEVDLHECGLELWETADAEVLPVRVVHVLRAKVCSPESYERNIFVFNNWQQFSDGRTRTRNGLLSEKLSLAELPLEDHLREVCTRAVTVEEMQRVEEAAYRVGPGYDNPVYNPSYQCPITVVDERYVDHTIEIVTSASYPTLLTLYHLYTVEIVCCGLPSVDFTTLEFEAPDASGHRKLKYVHGWCWLQWSLIQRYLFEGSELKDRKVKGSFKDAAELTSWLSQFDLELSLWGTGTWKSTQDLFTQVENGEANLEQWGRNDGVPLLMRVLHVVRLEVMSSDPRLLGKLLLLSWQQEPGGRMLTVNRLVTRVVKTLNLPFDERGLKEVATETLQEKLGFLVDAHFRLGTTTPMPAHLQESRLQIVRASLVDHHVSVDESPSYKGMCTLYHFYDMHVECQGLPDSEFASITFQCNSETGEVDKSKVRRCQGFRWVTWPCCIDIWREQAAANQRKQDSLKKACQQQQQFLSSATETVAQVSSLLEQLQGRLGSQEDQNTRELAEALALVRRSQVQLGEAKQTELAPESADVGDYSQALPPSMVSKMSQRTIVATETLQSATLRRMRLMRKLGSLEEENGVQATLSDRSTALEGSLGASSGSSRQIEDRIEEAFAAADTSGSGKVSEQDLETILLRINPGLQPGCVQSVVSAANLSCTGGLVNYRDFVRWLYEDQRELSQPF